MTGREIIYQNSSAVRIDKYLALVLKKSRHQIQQVLEKGLCLVNDKPVKAGFRLKPGAKIFLQEEVEEDSSRENGEKKELEIIYEDEAIIVVSKPAGLLTHAYPNSEPDSVISRVAAKHSVCPVGGPWRPGVVHRLDRYTSGVLVIARTELAYSELVTQFKNHQVDKSYLAVVRGIFAPGDQTFELGLMPRRKQPNTMHVRFLTGKMAITRAKLLRSFKGESLLEISPITGRTHQIRVTLSYFGYPILGDRKYGCESSLIGRPALHAWRLCLLHPVTGERKKFVAPLPDDFKNLLHSLKEE
ncbi:MAG: RluA family pseudouridine synthase [Candidatus Omnitrophica bacterium]|nr:RluA family pseudouridine synthase [Candidatus Omnitrophota bacterium]